MRSFAELIAVLESIIDGLESSNEMPGYRTVPYVRIADARAKLAEFKKVSEELGDDHGFTRI